MAGKSKPRLTRKRLMELLDYAPETGLFYWRETRGSVAAGLEAGTLHIGGYRVIRIGGVAHRAHRLVWLYVYGEHPIEEIDHKNRNPADNRIANLRQCSHAQNARNVVRRRNRSGFKGIYRPRSRWRAEITVNGTRIHLGVYSTPQEAADAYDAAARLHHGEFARTNAQIAAERIGESMEVRRTHAEVDANQ
jgi:hypothetical protein